MTSDVSYLCAPEWHSGRKDVKADFLILAPEKERGKSQSGFACCDYHAGDALKVMLEKWPNVIVRRVNAPSKQAGE